MQNQFTMDGSKIHNPIFILGAHKSGTSLLRAILDGHPDLLTLPIETHFFQCLEWWVEYPFRKTAPEQISAKRFIENACKWIGYSNSSEDNQADTVSKGLFNQHRFKEYLNQHLGNEQSINVSNFFTEYIKAIFFSLGEGLIPISPSKRIVEKSVENAEFAIDLCNMFPDATFLHVIRNPYSNLVSLRRYKTLNGYPWLGHLFKAIYNNYYFLYRNRRQIANYFICRYEDLVNNPEQSIKRICELVDIKFQETMLIPTHLGKPWQGNSTYATPYKQISDINLDNWKEEITPLEVSLINKNLLHVLEDFKYAKYDSPKSILWPAKLENLKTYLANRMYLRLNF